MNYVTPKGRRFIETSIHEQVQEAAQFATSMRAVSLVVGRPGNGKTTSVRRIAETDTGATLIDFKPRYRTVKGMHKAMMEAYGWFHNHRNGYDLEEAAEACARRCAETGEYFIVDEYQNFDLEAVRALLRFNDDFGLPIVLVGNFSRLRRTKADAHTFEQITSRIWKRIKLDNPTRQDFIEIGVEYNLEGQAAYEELIVLGHNTCIREVVQTLETARELRGEHGSLNVENLREAVNFLTEGATKNLALATAGLRTIR
jgi:DNA transposition AAA+ family ATPase